MEADLPNLLESWRKAGRFEWVVALAVLGLTLPTALTLYGEISTAKDVKGWISISVLSSILPLFALVLYRHWSQHRISRRIVSALLVSGWAPIGLFERLTDEHRKALQCKVLMSVPLFLGETISISEIASHEKSPHEKAIVHFQATVIFDLFLSFGLLERQGQNRIAAVSEHAAALLHCMALGIREQATLLTDWSVRDVADPAFQRAFGFISEAEDHRRALTRPSNWVPVRKSVHASLIVIKAVRNGNDEVLVRWSASWDTFNWVGGTQEIGDVDAAACAWREINEELGIGRSGDLSLDLVGSIESGPIKSARLGVYSTWYYTVFVLNARSFSRNNLPLVLDRIMQPEAEFQVFTDSLRLTKIRWIRWDTVACEADFASYGTELSTFLNARFSGFTPTFAFDIGATKST